MLNIYNLYPLLFTVLSYIYEVSHRVDNRYIKGNAIIIYNTSCINYDGIHNYHMLICICDIKICTFESKNYIKFVIYMGGLILSEYTLIKNSGIKPANSNNKIKITQTILFMDDLFTLNRIILYNCGILVHSNYYGSHIYNYKGERRTVEYINDFDNIQCITYV